MGIDEDHEGNKRKSPSLYGYMLTPVMPEELSSIPPFIVWTDEEEQEDAVSSFFTERMEKGILYILGPGRTMAAVGRHLGIDKTDLGVDAVSNGDIVGKDLDEDGIDELLDVYADARIIVSPLGSRGFIIGMSAPQISSQIIRRVGLRNVIILATPRKMKRTTVIRVDSGDDEVDERLSGYGIVVIGHGKEMVLPME